MKSIIDYFTHFQKKNHKTQPNQTGQYLPSHLIHTLCHHQTLQNNSGPIKDAEIILRLAKVLSFFGFDAQTFEVW